MKGIPRGECEHTSLEGSHLYFGSRSMHLKSCRLGKRPVRTKREVAAEARVTIVYSQKEM